MNDIKGENDRSETEYYANRIQLFCEGGGDAQNKRLHQWQRYRWFSFSYLELSIKTDYDCSVFTMDLVAVYFSKI